MSDKSILRLFGILALTSMIIMCGSLLSTHNHIYPPITSITHAQVQSADPCQSTAVGKLSTPINIVTATTVSLVAPGVSTNSQIFVCGITMTLSGTTPTFQLVTGTGATCGSSQAAMTGAFLGGTSTAPTAILTGVITVATTPAAFRLCAITTGTVNAQGVLTYLQQPQ